GRLIGNVPPGGIKIMPLPNVVPGGAVPVPPAGGVLPPRGGAGGGAVPMPVPAPGALPMPPKVAPGAPAPAGGAGGLIPAPAPMPVPVQGGNAQVVPGKVKPIAVPQQAAPKVDFDKQIVLAVSMGQGGVGRSIEITKIEQTKDGVKVYYREQLPDPTKPRP